MTTEQLTDFRLELQEALEDGADYARLRKIIDQYYTSGCTKSEAYKTLESLWLGYGFDDDEHQAANPLRDELEYAMEQVWHWDN